MRALPFALCLALASCSPQTSEQPDGAEPSPSQPEASAPYYSVDDLAALGLRTQALDGGRTLVCGAEDGSGCICLEPLPCEAEGNCITFDDNVEAFRSAVADGQDGRTVQCDRAETGRCGPFRYFDFQGDVERHEMRWFDENTVLVGQRNETDYQAYCDGATRARFQGRIPKCDAMSSPELICGAAASPPLPPIDDLRSFTAGPLQPGPASQP